MKVVITLTDVEPAVRLNARLEAADIQTVMVSPFDDLRGEIKKAKPDLIVFTGNLSDDYNIQIAKERAWEGVAIIGLADVIDPELNERLRAAGFTDIYAKPISTDELVDSVRRVLDRQRLASTTGLIGESEAIREVLVKVEQFAPVSSTVVIEGESGTGKELVARAIHKMSPRRGKPFIAVNVGALPDTLIESELFGHEKGAFTGAAERRLGRFELADTGTLFLDEIGEIPPATQVKLLRVLEEKEVTRVGGTKPIQVDVRVVAATNQPLRQRVEEGKFRADLYYRLSVLGIFLPPLRERRSDIALLVRRFIKEFSAQHERPFHGISAEAMQLLVDYNWPGNVRELRNLVESMVVLAPGHEIQPADIPREIRDGGGSRLLPVYIGPVVRGTEAAGGRELEFILHSLVELKLQVEELRRRFPSQQDEPLRVYGNGRAAPAVNGGEWVGEINPVGGESPAVRAIEAVFSAPQNATIMITPDMTMADIERAAIEGALKHTRGNRRKAAEILGIGERTMYRKLREYEIPIESIELE